MKRDTLVLYISMFIMGSCGIAYEYTFSKISSDLLGNSTKQWAIIIGLMMLFMGIGSDIQKYIKDKNIITKFIFFEAILAFIGGGGPLLLLYIFGEFRDFYTLFQYLFIVSTGTIIGMEIPLLTRVNEQYSTELKVNLGGILKMDYIGSFLGALLWVFILPLWFNIIESGMVLGSFNIFVALLTLLYFKDRIKKFKSMLALILVIFSFNLFMLYHGEGWTIETEQNLYRDKIVLSKTTLYQHIILTESENGIFNCYINGNLQFSSVDEHIYHEMLVHPAINLADKYESVLILGGGDGLAVRELLKYDGVKEITLVDIDPLMTDLAATDPNFVALNDSAFSDDRINLFKSSSVSKGDLVTIYNRNKNIYKESQYDSVATVHIYNIDAFSFIDEIDKLYDLIIIDFPDPNSQELSKLYSSGFYTRVSKKLTKYGVAVQQSTSPYHAKESYLCIGRTIEDSGFNVLPYHQNVPSFGEWGFWIFSKGRDIYKPLDEMIPVDTHFFTPEIFQSSKVFGKGILETDEVEINTIINNVVYKYYEKAWRDL